MMMDQTKDKCTPDQQRQQQGSKRPLHKDALHPNNRQPPSKKLFKSNAKNKELKFRHGNYNRYYGYRNANQEKDQRISALDECWFRGKKCLDIGCNVGHLTLWIAKYFQVAKMKGVDIDCELIKAAKNNIVNYIENDEVVEKTDDSQVIHDQNSNAFDSPTKHTTENRKFKIENAMKKIENTTAKIKNIGTKNENNETQNENINDDIETTIRNNETKTDNTGPNTENISLRTENGENQTVNNNITMQISEYGHTKKEEIKLFPYNVSFVTENFVPSSSTVLLHVKEVYDVIMCFSVTKWIQLNSGDEGLKLLFKKIHKLLYRDGIFILEPQPFKSYKRKKNLTPEIRRNYDNIKLLPEHYVDYLLSDDVGFRTAEQIEITKYEKQGFQRPIYVLKK